MESSKDYYERVMRDYATKGSGRSLKKYCQDEGVDYGSLSRYKKTFRPLPKDKQAPSGAEVEEVPELIKLHCFEQGQGTDDAEPRTWEVASMVLTTPGGEMIEIKCNSLSAASELLHKMSV